MSILLCYNEALFIFWSRFIWTWRAAYVTLRVLTSLSLENAMKGILLVFFLASGWVQSMTSLVRQVSAKHAWWSAHLIFDGFSEVASGRLIRNRRKKSFFHMPGFGRCFEHYPLNSPDRMLIQLEQGPGLRGLLYCSCTRTNVFK